MLLPKKMELPVFTTLWGYYTPIALPLFFGQSSLGENRTSLNGDYATFSDSTFGSPSDATQNSFQSFRQQREFTSCALGTEPSFGFYFAVSLWAFGVKQCFVENKLDSKRPSLPRKTKSILTDQPHNRTIPNRKGIERDEKRPMMFSLMSTRILAY